MAVLCGLLLARGHRAAAVAVLGFVCMWLCFLIGHGLIRVVLSPGVGAFGVARTLVDEAVRIRVVLAFVIGLLVMTPLGSLFFLMDPNELLKYRVQGFLTWTLSGSAMLLGVMTLFLACSTICHEIDRCQIFLTLTKPIGRGQYLLGKWLGIVLLDLLLVGIVGIGVYTFSKVLQQNPHRNQADRHAVDQQIFVARQAVTAQPPATMDINAMVAKRVQEQQDTQTAVAPGLERFHRQAIIAKWHTIAPRGTQTYVFANLHRARAFGRWVQLRFKPVSSMAPPKEQVRLAVWLNGRPYPFDADTHRHLPLVVANNRYQVLDLPVDAIGQDGRLEIRIANVNLDDMRATFPSSVGFTPGKGLEVLYQVGRFEPNLIRALVLVWIRLAFLAMLGLTAGTFLGFPVACLLGVLVYVTAAANGFLLESMEQYVSFSAHHQGWWERLVWVPKTFLVQLVGGEFWDAFKILVRLLGNTFVLLIPSFSDYDPVALIADGRWVPYDMILAAVVRVGGVWTGFCGLLGWLIFRRRELAQVTV